MKTITFDPSGLRNKRELREALDGLMDYEGWHETNAEAWVEMVSFFDRPDCPVGNSADAEHFKFEILNSTDFLENKSRLVKEMVRLFTHVNELYMERNGNPLISVVFMG